MVAVILEAGGEARLTEGEEAALGARRGVRRVSEGVGASPLALGAVSGLEGGGVDVQALAERAEGLGLHHDCNLRELGPVQSRPQRMKASARGMRQKKIVAEENESDS